MNVRALVAMPVTGLCAVLTIQGPAAPSAATPVAQQTASATPRQATTPLAAQAVLPSLRASYLNLNWAGYVQTGRTTEVSGRFRVPTTAARPSGYAATWVGIDGYHTTWLAQAGIGEIATSGRASYYAWWEVLTPSTQPPQQRFALAVRPGDLVQVRVSTSGGRATLRVDNLTTRRYATRTVAYAGPGRSGEWVQEAVNVDGRISPSPNWGHVDFTNLTRNRVNPWISSVQALDIVDSHGTRETVTGSPVHTRNGFKVSWRAGGSWTSVG